MKSFFELLGFLATAVLSGAAIFLYLGHAKNLPPKERSLAAAYLSDEGIEYDAEEAPAARPARQPRSVAKRPQLPDFEPIAAHPAGEIPAKSAKPKSAPRASEPPVLPKKLAEKPAERPRAAPPAKPKIALADARPERLEAAAKSGRASKMSRERASFEAAVPRAVGREATKTELDFREMVAKEQGFRSWSQLQRKASDAQKGRATQRVKMLLAASRIR